MWILDDDGFEDVYVTHYQAWIRTDYCLKPGMTNFNLSHNLNCKLAWIRIGFIKKVYSPCVARVIGRFKYEKSHLHTYPDCPPARHEIYRETFSSDEIIGDYYFLNPILFKNKLAKEDLLGAILYFSSGIKCSAKFNSQPHIKKFIPSNGARYPFFPIIYINNGGNITPGIYKYHPYLHSLIRVQDKQHFKDVDIRIVFKGTVERVMSRYPNGVAYQDLLFDLGHLITTLKMCFSHYGISYTLRTSIDANSEVNLMDLELLTIDLRINT